MNSELHGIFEKLKILCLVYSINFLYLVRKNCVKKAFGYRFSGRAADKRHDMYHRVPTMKVAKVRETHPK